MKKIKYTFNLVLISLLLLVSITNTIFAAEIGALLDDPTLNKEIIEKNDNEVLNKDSLIEQMSDEIGIYAEPSSSYVISVSNFKQENGHYCGPASVRQALSFHKNQSGSSAALPSQATLAGKIGTTSSGSISTAMRDALNSYKSTYSFKSSYVVTNVGNDKNQFSNRILNVIKNKSNAPILLLETQYIPRYNGHASRHYNTVSGHSINQGVIRTVDPNNNSAYQGIYWDPIGSTTANGIFKAVYNADLHGSNYVMIY